MHKEITLQKQQVAYTLKKSDKARNMRISANIGGVLIVTIPRNMNERFVEKFIIEKASWILKKIEYFKQFGGVKMLRFSRSHYLKHKEIARELIISRVEYFAVAYGFQYNRVSIKNQKTRWGSCSRRGNLNFNYKIFLLSPDMRDYIIAHELCHLKELNHSRKFWTLVEEIMPDYRVARKALKKQGLFFQ